MTMMGKLEQLIKNNPVVQKTYIFFGSAFMRFLSLFYTSKPNRILFSAMSGSCFQYTSPYVLFLAIKKLYGDQYEYVWAFKRNEIEKHGDVQRVQIDTFKYFKECFKAGIWITDVNIERGLHFKKKKQYYVNTWHGGLTKGYPKRRKDYRLTDVSIFCSDGAAYDAFFAEHYKVRQSAFLHCGRPREDALFSLQNKRLKIRKKMGFPPNDYIILYMPTWRDADKEATSIYLDPTQIINSIPNSVFVFHAHHLSKSGIASSDNRIIDVSDNPDVNELYVAADLLITDYSSCMYDYLLLDKPVLLFVPDYDEYKAQRGLARDFAAEFPIGLAKNVEELLMQIHKVQNNFDKESFRFFLHAVVERNEESATKAIIDKMVLDQALSPYPISNE